MAVPYAARRYIVAPHHHMLSSSSAIMIGVGRGDGLPPRDRFGERLRQDFAAMLSEDEAIAQLRDILRRLTRHGQAD